MTKARLVPVYFPGRDQDFDQQVSALRELLADVAEIAQPVALGQPLGDADAALFPQVLGDAYRMVEAIRAIDIPRLVVTSRFGTMSMWDWEIGSFLRAQGVSSISPYSLEQTRKICRALAVKRQLRETKFLVFQDNPGEGFQPEIFKRFFWWEDECSQRMFQKFGITVVKKSFKEMAAQAKAIPDSEAGVAWNEWQSRLNLAVPAQARNSALKLYLQVKHELDADPTIGGVGINCLNESHFSDTTPCLAWNMLYEIGRASCRERVC